MLIGTTGGTCDPRPRDSCLFRFGRWIFYRILVQYIKRIDYIRLKGCKKVENFDLAIEGAGRRASQMHLSSGWLSQPVCHPARELFKVHVLIPTRIQGAEDFCHFLLGKHQTDSLQFPRRTLITAFTST